MVLINRYTILPTASFKKELNEIVYYLKNKLKEPKMAKRFYKNVIKNMNSLNFMPERYKRIEDVYNRKKNLRRMLVNNYVIIYEVKKDTSQVFILHIFHGNQNYLEKL